MGATLHSIGIGRNQYMEGVIPQPVSSQMPSSTGVFEQPSSRDVVVLLLGTRVNHPLGVLAPGAVKMAKYFGAMMTELNENASQYCLLGASNGWLEADRETHNNIMTVFYFENIEGLHKFAHGPLHREAVKWYHSTVKDYPHLSIWHETFHSPAGHWETVYGGSAPTLMGLSKSSGSSPKSPPEQATQPPGSNRLPRRRPLPRQIHQVLADLASVVASLSSGVTPNLEKSFKEYQARYPSLSDAVLLDLLPATPTQQVFIDRKTFHSYHFALNGRIDVDRLRRVCDAMMARYSILRTVFWEHEGCLIQAVLGNVKAPFRHRQAKRGPMAQCRSQWETDMSQFDIRDGLAVSWTLFSNSPVDHVFALQLSHAQWDGLSIPYLFQDLAAAYNNASLPPTSDFTLYLHRCATLDRAAPYRFWRDYLSGSSLVAPFPSSHTRSPGQATTTVMAVTSIQPPELPAGFTMATLIKAAAAFYLTRLLAKTDIVFGQTVNGRNMALDNVDVILGPCLNFIPMRVALQPEWTVQDLLANNTCEWPAGSELTFIVQHQNIRLEQNLPLEGMADVRYSLFANFDPLKEVWVFSEPHSDWLEIQICANSGVLTKTQSAFLSAEIAKLVELFWQSPDMLLDSAVEHICPHMLRQN
ncbi:hypothetical protein ALT_4952 [Aspergillus lentulus]|uniref:Condensation domain-containing protein n=1 Tax=Aspergillus lentulus TaxID=293939 RepID=A0AAN4PKA9_ASPLE|nr:hypothetical protein ALT_4952 [Aspergillus lentulus]